DSAELDAAAVQLKWLVKQVLVAGQPAVIGGPKKVLKTSVVIDLAVALGSGTRFLNKFEVPHPEKVLMLSGESGVATIRDTARRVCQAKGISLASAGVVWGFELPQLTNGADLEVLFRTLVAKQIDLVIVDPLYLCLLAGNPGGRQASNMFDVGPILFNVTQACLDAGTTPAFVHHTRRLDPGQRGRETEPLGLDDLAYAGVAEFARQWLLISRSEPFNPEAGQHKLWLSLGSSAGHSGLYAVDVREGILDDAFGGRQWQVSVQQPSKAIEASARAKEECRKQAKEM